jgi:NADPH:quinone reductase-like Zn-dependent oxidoreductase
MRQVVETRNGGTDVLKVQEKPKPTPRAKEVSISVKAAGLNFADILARRGLYPDAPKPPCVLGYEVSGIVENVGEDSDRHLMGRAVVALTHFGGFSENVNVPASLVFDKPTGLSFEESAAIPINYLTAYTLLVAIGSLSKGESILIHNAGGGVGLAALDIAKHIGAVVYGTASARKHAFLKGRGLDYAIDYTTHDWLQVLKELTNGHGVNLVIDPIGGNHWRKSYRALSGIGRLGMFGLSGVKGSGLRGKLGLVKLVIESPWFNSLSVVDKNRGVFGVNLGRLWNEEERLRESMTEILKGVDEGWVRPHVDKVFAFEQAPEAHAYLENRLNIGKVILVP